ncbi:hypothetical protein VTI74DRAFT_6035 [Chaetomium olivicolor]
METMKSTYIQEAYEIKEWRAARALVHSVVPGPLLSRLGRLSPIAGPVGPREKDQKAGLREPHHKEMLKQQQAGVQLARLAEEANSKPIPSADRQPEIGGRAFDASFSRARGFVSALSLAATIAGPSRPSSGVDWKSGSQGLDLLLNSSREYMDRLNGDAEGTALEFERATYINGAQHVLRGLPRDLDPAEAALLHRAMPQALAATASPQLQPTPNPPHPSPESGQRNIIHIIALFTLCCLSSLATWLIPKVRLYATKALQADQEHKYSERAWLLMLSLFQLLCEALRRARKSTPGQVLLVAFGYTTQGVWGAVSEFAEGKRVEGKLNGVEDVNRTGAKGGMKVGVGMERWGTAR